MDAPHTTPPATALAAIAAVLSGWISVVVTGLLVGSVIVCSIR